MNTWRPFVLLLFFLVGACEADHELVISDPEYFIAVHQTADITSDELLQSFNTDKFEEVVSLAKPFVVANHIRAVVITYHTVDPDGNPVIADGSIYYPLDGEIRGVVEMMPIAHISKFAGPSSQLPSKEGLPALCGYAVFVPDLIGYGQYGNTQDLPHPYLMAQNLGRVVYDLRKAASEYMQTRGYIVPERTTLCGYSYGGGVAMAAAKYYQTHHAQEITIDRVVAGGGAYDMNAVFAGYVQNPICEYPLLPAVILSLNHYYRLNLDYHQLFQGDLADNCEAWYDRTHTSSYIMHMIGSDMRSYMHPDFFKEERNSTFAQLQPAMDQNSAVDGWTPQMPIYLYHATDDLNVPINSAQYAMQAFSKRGAQVIFKYGEGGHSKWGARAFADLMAYLCLR